MKQDVKERINNFINSTDIDMVVLGVVILLTECTEQEVRQWIPWHRYSYISSTLHSGKQPLRLPYFAEGPQDIKGGLPLIIIKAGIGVRMTDGSIVCMSTGLLMIHRDFDDTKKIYI